LRGRTENQILAVVEESDEFAEIYPEDKYFIVKNFQKGGHVVGMTGDGGNDAPTFNQKVLLKRVAVSAWGKIFNFVG